MTLLAGALLGVLAGAAPASVVFVCEHGNVKSLIAKEWFDRLAAERGLALHATSRGLAPEPAVAPTIADKLRTDGFDVREFHPRALAPEDLRGVSRLVLIGADPPDWIQAEKVVVERWDGIPPASERYEASRDAMKERIGLLLDSLAGSSPKR